MPTEIYPILFIIAGIIYYLTTRKKPNQVEKVGKVDLQSLLQSSFKYVVIVRSNGTIYKSYEEDDLGKAGYHIYSKYGQSINKIDVYVKDNESDKFMLIEKDKESESMFAVNHPENGFIGYLRFDYVDNIK